MFVAAVVLSVDILFTFLDFEAGRLVQGRGPLLDGWDAGKAAAAAIGMLVIAWYVRSPGSAVFALVFVLIGLQDELAWHGSAGASVSSAFDFRLLQKVLPASPEAWGQFLVLTALAATGAIFIWFVPDRWPGFRSIRNVLTILLGALFLFATVVDLLADAASPGSVLTLLEESGERLTLSLTVGYVAGLVAAVTEAPSTRAQTTHDHAIR